MKLVKKVTSKPRYWAIAIIIFLYIGLSAGIFLAYRLENSTRKDVLCPLYGLLSESYNPAAGDRHPKGKEWYEQAFVTIRKGSEIMECPPINELFLDTYTGQVIRRDGS